MSSGRGGTLRHVPTTKTEHAAQHTTHIDVDFPTRTGRAGGAGGGARAPALAYIRFRNYYARSVTVRQLMTPPAGPPAAARWSTLLADYQLMRSSHHEDDAQAWHVLCVPDDFRRGAFYPGSLTRLRFEVSQPSAMWNTFSLRHIECFELCGTGGGSGTGGRGGDAAARTHSGTFGAQTLYTAPYDHARTGTFDHPGAALASVRGRAGELADTLRKLSACECSKIGNPGSALDFSHGVAMAVRIEPRNTVE
jgi:hypothetical protein